MKRINKPLAILLENKELLENVTNHLNRGFSQLYISNKYGISRYLVRRVAELIKLKEE